MSFFFQAEDGIRDRNVTGVQTCALPIFKSVAFSADGKRIVSGSWDKSVKVWDADKGQEVRTLEGHTDAVSSVAFSPDGKRIEIGRASCRERVEVAVVEGSSKNKEVGGVA